jgi:hypothetical protein
MLLLLESSSWALVWSNLRLHKVSWALVKANSFSRAVDIEHLILKCQFQLVKHLGGMEPLQKWKSMHQYPLLALALKYCFMLFEFWCELEFLPVWFLPWLGVPSYLNFTMAWSSKLFDFCHGLEIQAIWVLPFVAGLRLARKGKEEGTKAILKHFWIENCLPLQCNPRQSASA